MKVLLLGVGTALLLISGSVVAQDRAANKAGCALIKKDCRAQFISYEGTSKSGVRLRIHNNTNCTIVVETDDAFPTQVVRLPNGEIRLETVTVPTDGVRLSLHYLVQNRARQEVPKPAYGWGDSVYHYEIKTGASAIFSIPVALFQKQLDVVVPFNYSWEAQTFVGRGAGGVTHVVYFLFDDAPKALWLGKQDRRALIYRQHSR
jgi:hypothetical protein